MVEVPSRFCSNDWREIFMKQSVNKCRFVWVFFPFSRADFTEPIWRSIKVLTFVSYRVEVLCVFRHLLQSLSDYYSRCGPPF